MKIQDGGDAYTPAPWWCPFRRQIGYWGCVIIGRWIGGLLGYRPFFREYTTDWDYVVAKMKGSLFQRHLVNESFAAEKSWDGQVHLEPVSKPTSAEFEPWTLDMSPNPLVLGPVKEYKLGGRAEKAADGGVNGKATGLQLNGDLRLSADGNGPKQELRSRMDPQ